MLRSLGPQWMRHRRPGVILVESCSTQMGRPLLSAVAVLVESSSVLPGEERGCRLISPNSGCGDYRSVATLSSVDVIEAELFGGTGAPTGKGKLTLLQYRCLVGPGGYVRHRCSSRAHCRGDGSPWRLWCQ